MAAAVCLPAPTTTLTAAVSQEPQVREFLQLPQEMITAIVVTAGIESLQHVAATCQVLRRIVQGEDASEQLARALYPASTLRDVSTETWRERLVNDNKHKCVRAVEMRAVCNWVHNDAEGSFYQNRVVRARLCASPMPSFRSSRGRCAVARKVSLMHADRADLLLS